MFDVSPNDPVCYHWNREPYEWKLSSAESVIGQKPIVEKEQVAHATLDKFHYVLKYIKYAFMFIYDEDAKVVMCLVTYNRRPVTWSIANTHELDDFSIMEGCKIAFGRALVNMEFRKATRTELWKLFWKEIN